MAGELVAFRRAAIGAPIVNYGRLVDRERINFGGRGVGTDSSADTATSVNLKTVTAHTSANTKGLWQEMIASTAVAAETICFGMYTVLGVSTNDTSTLLDIGFGADTAEVVKIANIPIGFARAFNINAVIPFAVPAGTRVAFRIQSAAGGQAVSMGCEVHAAGDHSAAPTVATTYNANTTTSNVTTVMTVPGGTNTESTWTQIGTTSAAHNRFLVCPTGPASNSHTASNSLIDIAYGTGGAEIVIASNIPFGVSLTEIVTYYVPMAAYTASVGNGQPLWARYQTATSVATGARPNVVLIGLGN